MKVTLKAAALAILLSIVSVEAGEAPAPEPTLEQMTIEQLWKLESRIETQRDLFMNQVAATLKLIGDEKAKRANAKVVK